MREEILSVPAGSLRDSDSRTTVEEWSSLVDAQIMTVMGSERDVEEDTDVMSFKTVGNLLDDLEQRGALTG
jgi:hypothetical protein